jgi:hypothetical protein
MINWADIPGPFIKKEVLLGKNAAMFSLPHNGKTNCKSGTIIK